MKTIEDLNLENKRVIIRCDLDVPLNEDGTISDDHRIQAALPTITYAKEKNAKVIILGHMGRPKGKVVENLSLKKVATRLAELLHSDVAFVNECVGPEVEAKVGALKAGEVLVLENVRFHEGEEKNDQEFSKALAKNADIYINNAFATAHRAHASTAGIASYVAEKGAGFTLRDEVEYFNRSVRTPKRPFLAIFGGAKVSTKIEAIKNVGKVADAVIVGGAMANTFFSAMGYEVGKSLVEPDLVPVATEAIKWFKENDKQLLLPVDVVIADALKTGLTTSIVDAAKIPVDKMALDIGPKSLELFATAIKSAETIVWNGPMGAFETTEFSNGTYTLVDLLCETEALTVVGGGDTDLALHNKHAFDKMDFVSTAGGAFLEMLEGKKLPGVEALV